MCYTLYRSKKYVCVAQLDRALGYGPRCRGFESSHARAFNRKGQGIKPCPFSVKEPGRGCSAPGFNLASGSVGAAAIAAWSTGPAHPLTHEIYVHYFVLQCLVKNLHSTIGLGDGSCLCLSGGTGEVFTGLTGVTQLDQRFVFFFIQIQN